MLLKELKRLKVEDISFTSEERISQIKKEYVRGRVYTCDKYGYEITGLLLITKNGVYKITNRKSKYLRGEHHV